MSKRSNEVSPIVEKTLDGILEITRSTALECLRGVDSTKALEILSDVAEFTNSFATRLKNKVAEVAYFDLTNVQRRNEIISKLQSSDEIKPDEFRPIIRSLLEHKVIQLQELAQLIGIDPGSLSRFKEGKRNIPHEFYPLLRKSILETLLAVDFIGENKS